jgi:hypothetical protein
VQAQKQLALQLALQQLALQQLALQQLALQQLVQEVELLALPVLLHLLHQLPLNVRRPELLNQQVHRLK